MTLYNTPIDWSGKRWTELLWPLCPKGVERPGAGDWWLPVEIAHELLHRTQPSLQLSRPDGGNGQLDTLDGRYLLQLESRALAEALFASDPRSRRSAIEDELLFRRERYHLFLDAAVREFNLAINEGMPEYTGVRLGLNIPRQRIAYVVYDLSAFEVSPTFVRSFAYATGPCYGLLLDQAKTGWRRDLQSGQRLDQLVRTALRLPEPAFGRIGSRDAAYNDGSLLGREVVRDQARQERLHILEAQLVDGLVLKIALMAPHFNRRSMCRRTGERPD